MEDVVASIIWSISEWVLSRKEFKGVCLEDLSRYWAAHFQGGWVSKSLNGVFWECPPTGFLKLNFDGIMFKLLEEVVLEVSLETRMALL